MAGTAAIIGAAAAVASAGTGIAASTGAFGGGGGGGGVPKLPSIDTAAITKPFLPGAKADAAARSGGGISPEFLANLVGERSGQPSGGLDILGQIRESLNVQGP